MIVQVKVSGGQLVVESEGRGDVTVVLVHAGVADRAMWDGVVPALAEGHRVVRYDLRGFGASAPAGAEYRHAEDLLGVLDALEVERAVLVGASYGGKVTLEFASLHPDRVIGVAVLAPPLPGYDWSAEMRAYGAAEETALERRDFDAAVSLNLDMWVRGPSRTWDETLRAHAAAVREAMRVSLVNQHLSDEHERHAVPDLAGVLGGIGVPALVAVGNEDVPDFQAIAERVAAALPGARLTRLPDTGHLIAVERPAETARLLLSFLEELDELNAAR
ncbi:alpha/beta fold hydrolase [Streptomyces litchfieldiae]|uniref:Alpha/beta hydrolase n=1 Tax=Streptomyces litchfieldiae TaxID=3075543 RepID=A0ABU2MLK7_9ACTN|nr:alpha/beta hydrolase [Streptomyces sp. DSM 44938]MDT0341529.1 alpha/beta hydrolase [Streptomyces sp. DSM 44938]